MTHHTEEKKPIRTIIDQETKVVVGYACGNCGAFFAKTSEVSCAKEAAERCHNYTCSDCGVKTDQYRTLCQKCIQLREQKKDKERYDEAPKVKYGDYKGAYLYFDDTRIGREGYLAVEDLEDELVAYDGELPTYAWACMPFYIDASDVVDQALEDHYENASDDISSTEIKKLQSYLDAWCESQHITSYMENGTVVEFEESLLADLNAERADDT